MTPSPRVVLITHPRRGAEAFARELLERRLAACVNLFPIASVYRWRGTLESAREQQLVIKTTAPRLAALRAHVSRAHPYDTPEFLVLSAAAASRYGAWLAVETAPGAPRGR